MASLEDQGTSAQRIEDDRGMAIEASIVRILKSRKRLTPQFVGERSRKPKTQQNSSTRSFQAIIPGHMTFPLK